MRGGGAERRLCSFLVHTPRFYRRGWRNEDGITMHMTTSGDGTNRKVKLRFVQGRMSGTGGRGRSETVGNPTSDPRSDRHRFLIPAAVTVVQIKMFPHNIILKLWGRNVICIRKNQRPKCYHKSRAGAASDPLSTVPAAKNLKILSTEHVRHRAATIVHGWGVRISKNM